MAAVLTRAATEHSLFGSASVLPEDRLPSKGDMLRNCWQYKCDGGKFADVSMIVKMAAQDCSEIWEKAIGDRKVVPLLSQKVIEERLRKLYSRGIDINKNKHVGKKNKFQEEMKELFDICSCYCPPASCQDVRCKIKECDGYHLACHCDIKVPKREVQFLLDQRGERKMKIAGVDLKVTRMWEKVTGRERHAAERSNIQLEQSYRDLVAGDVPCEGDNSDDARDISPGNTDDDFIPDARALTDSISQNRTRLPTLAATCDRYLISDYAGAAIATATLIDYGIITKNDKSQVIGPHKVRYERQKYRLERQETEMASLESMTSLYFDGKKTATRVMVKNEKTNKWSSKIMVKDHYVIMVEPGNEYLTHVTPISGHGKEIAKAVHKFLVEKNLTQQPIVCVGSDGTYANVGSAGGAIHHLEMLLGHPLHYFICQLHGNELPFRAVFYKYDGKPSGPEHWRGPIGRQIKEPLSDLPVVAFQAINFTDFPVLNEEVEKDLSWDQNYLYRICNAIIAGAVDDDLAAIEPGPPCVSRWNTLWSRILRLYVATPRPSYELKRIVIVILKFSAPMWFFIKLHPYVTHGPRNVFQSLQYMKQLNNEEKVIVKKTVQRNAFFAHTDQLLLAMCADEDRDVRENAVSMIRKIREENQPREECIESSEGDAEDSAPAADEEKSEEGDVNDDMPSAVNIRKVVTPKLKWQAQNYHSMINWTNELKTEPPYIASLSDHQVTDIIKIPLVLPKWPNHTQAVERGIKVMTEACTEVTGYSARDGYIRQRLMSRKMMPRFRTKRDFTINLS